MSITKKIKAFFECDHCYAPIIYNPCYLKYGCIKCGETKEYRFNKELEQFEIVNKNGKYKNVLLTETEFNKLVSKFGLEKAKQKIIEMDDAIEMKGCKYKSHYLAILKGERNKMSTNTEAKRNKLKASKPKVYEKVIKFEEMQKAGKSTAIMHLQYDYKCNMKCQHCSIRRMQKKQNRRSMSPLDIENLSKQAHDLGLARWVITGGEPLIFPDLEEIVKAINPELFYINLDTNGWLLNAEKAEWLKSIGVDRIQLSLDSMHASQHDEFRNMPGSWGRAVEAIYHAQNAGLDIFINTVCTKERLHSFEFKMFLQFINLYNIGVYVSFAKPVGAWEGRKDILIDKSDLEYMKELEKQYNVFTHLTPAYGLDMGCIAVKGMITITKYGDVLPCQYLQVSIGNIFEDSLEQIIKNGQSIDWFGKYQGTCFMADKTESFIADVLEKHVYTAKSLPVHYKEIWK
jgi:MoaA/NifB/PqqE/SkfB family radical SAM enzyme